MNAGLQPQAPAACGVADGVALVSAACGAALQGVCSGGSTNPDDGTLRSLLLDPASNCSRWYSAVLAANATNAPGDPPAGGSAALDAAMAAFCATPDGAATPECGCLSFPTRAAAWCAAGAATCAGQPPGACAAQQFAQANPDGSLDVVQFTGCSPYWCWLSACFDPPSRALLPSSILAAQSNAAAACPGVCAQLVAPSSIDVLPMPPGSFAPAGVTPNVTGIGSCGAPTKPTMLVVAPQAWTFPLDADVTVPIIVTNDGDAPAMATASLAPAGAAAAAAGAVDASGVCGMAPADPLPVMGRSTARFALTCDAAGLAQLYTQAGAAAGGGGGGSGGEGSGGGGTLTLQADVQLAYTDSETGVATTAGPYPVTLSITPPVPPAAVEVPGFPPWLLVVVAAACLAAAVLAAVALALAAARRRLPVSSPLPWAQPPAPASAQGPASPLLQARTRG